MSRRSHSSPEIEEAVRYAEENGWRVDVGGGHCWGKLYCPYNDERCRGGVFCISSVWSTPRSSGNHARQIKRVVDNCTTNNVVNDLCEEEE
jgi:hypothetical protein